MAKYIFVTGGVASGIGKGIIASSLGHILTEVGYKPNIAKLDPYINVDPGTLNPVQHGEVYVTRDGGETDLDLGHYTRFTDTEMRKENSITAGQVYLSVIDSERNGDYAGITVQVTPHITGEIQKRLLELGHKKRIVIVEIGGTVGDIESLAFIEAIRDFGLKLRQKDPNSVCYCHTVWLPRLSSGEIKTKPAQHAIKTIQSHGIHPDIIFARIDKDMPEEARDKLKRFCGVETVIQARDIQGDETLYSIPYLLKQEGVHLQLSKKLGLSESWSNNTKPNMFVASRQRELDIAILGKYDLDDAYISIRESLIHAALKTETRINIHYEISDDNKLVDSPYILDKYDGIIIAGGFGSRDVAKKIKAAEYALATQLPTLGICLGFQCMIISWARMAGLSTATSQELDVTTNHPVISLRMDQQNVRLGGTMRLGEYPCELVEGSRVHKLYNTYREPYISVVQERHRHRYEFNNDYDWLLNPDMLSQGFVPIGYLKASGIYKEENLVEIVELEPASSRSQYDFFYVGTQFHPEFESTLSQPHPLFMGLVNSALSYKDYRLAY